MRNDRDHDGNTLSSPSKWMELRVLHACIVSSFRNSSHPTSSTKNEDSAQFCSCGSGIGSPACLRAGRFPGLSEVVSRLFVGGLCCMAGGIVSGPGLAESREEISEIIAPIPPAREIVDLSVNLQSTSTTERRESACKRRARVGTCRTP